jgi:3',5'-cyclic AMP phosphodiesterase CpdA
MANLGNSPLVRFGIITDIHFSSKEKSAAARTTAADLRSCLDCWQRNKIDFLLQLGDLIKGSETHKHQEPYTTSSATTASPSPVRSLWHISVCKLPFIRLP